MKKDGLGFERLLIFLTGLNLILRLVLYVQEKREVNEKD
jgi:aspartyl/asparaginyl-tRNA synthetase